MTSTLDISLLFTIEDIHKIRERNYEVTKNMTIDEKLQYYIPQEPMQRSR
jgi:hypothetical protein